jgi:hypothetical protein
LALQLFVTLNMYLKIETIVQDKLEQTHCWFTDGIDKIKNIWFGCFCNLIFTIGQFSTENRIYWVNAKHIIACNSVIHLYKYSFRSLLVTDWCSKIVQYIYFPDCQINICKSFWTARTCWLQYTYYYNIVIAAFPVFIFLHLVFRKLSLW